MSAIGTITCDGWRGTIQGPAASVETWRRAGVEGNGASVSAAHGRPSEIETDHLGTGTEIATAEAMVGTTVSVTDCIGDTWSDVLVMSVTGTIRAVVGVDGGSTHLTTLRWQLLVD